MNRMEVGWNMKWISVEFVCVWAYLRERKVGFVAITPTIKLFSAGSGDLFFADIGQDEEWRRMESVEWNSL